MSTPRVISEQIAATGIVPNTYGDATNSAQVTINSQGQVTAATEVAISGVPAAAHNILSTTHGDTLADTVVAGDILTGNATPKWSRLAKGTTNYVLKAGASILAWGQVAFSELTGTAVETQGGTNQTSYTLGDILYSSASNVLSKLAGNTTTTKKFLRQTGNGSISAAPAWDTLVNGDLPANISVLGTFGLAADISPASIGSNQNDYNPTGLSDATVLRLSSSTDVNITGLQGGADGRIIIIINIGGNNITLKNQDVGSSAANRFLLNQDIELLPIESAVLQYDSTSTMWRELATTHIFGGGISEVVIDVDGSNMGAGDELDFQQGSGFYGGVSIVATQGVPTDPVEIVLATVLTSVGLTAQAADISATSLSGSGTNGLYRISYYIVVTTADGAAGAITLTFASNDGTAARSQAAAAVNLTATNFLSGEFVTRVGNSTAPTYAISHTGSYGTAQYALYITSERIQ